ncbi:hypothetical protein OHA21_33225 [Actinoplanes sp. NBC_00393]|uniref:hypothetical protein n=1 Tax=Actinoplanes sp. NBC_00393 TaxID=2975953 RepID=UPI002E24484C
MGHRAQPGGGETGFRASGVDPLPPSQRMPAIISGMFGAAALRRASNPVPRAEEWRPDLVIPPVTELAGAIAATRTGARHAVHGLGPLPAEAWDWFGARTQAEPGRSWRRSATGCRT